MTDTTIFPGRGPKHLRVTRHLIRGLDDISRHRRWVLKLALRSPPERKYHGTCRDSLEYLP